MEKYIFNTKIAKRKYRKNDLNEFFDVYANKCKYGELSRLNENIKGISILDDHKLQKNIEEYAISQSLYIDGTTCVGKSSLCGKNALKVNLFFDVTRANFDPIHSANYLLGNLLLNRSCNLIDRGPFSNLAWLIIQHIITLKKEVFQIQSYHGIINNFLVDSNAYPILEFIKANFKNVIVFIDSNINKSRDRMKLRALKTNNLGDFKRSYSYKYFILQNVVYSYLAKLCNYLIIDLEFYRHYPEILAQKNDTTLRDIIHGYILEVKQFIGISESEPHANCLIANYFLNDLVMHKVSKYSNR